ncbi:protein of unknown function [Tenacibaculum sp. 190524A02b]|uniref:RHS repeat domain-containing protein n=1 Tax=Tenacibaculum vairaonense TaxID=3137860 RepID=UPI0032B17A7B
MKKNFISIFFIVFLNTLLTPLLAQHGCIKVVNGTLNFDGTNHQTLRVVINKNPENCVGSSLGIGRHPSWLSIQQHEDYIDVSCVPNTSGTCRTAEVFFNDGTDNPHIPPSPRGSIRVIQTTSGEENLNWIQSEQRDINGKVIAKARNYFNVLGKSTQSQSVDIKTGKTWVSQTMYDSHGRPALQSLSAPSAACTSNGFQYVNGFIRNEGGAYFTKYNFENNPENPSEVGSFDNSVGWYYSESNNTEPYQDKTTRPYSRTIYSELNPGAILKTIGGNQINGEWKNGYSFSMPAGQELSQHVAFNDPKYNTQKIVKTVTRDVHGIENVVFTDTDGNTLATARSGNEEGNPNNTRTSTISIGTQGFVDIHIPVGRKGISFSGNQGNIIEIYDLITEKRVGIKEEYFLPPGFYRIAVSNPDTYTAGNISVTYPENYYDYSLNEYDTTGRLVASYQPLRDGNQNKLKSEFRYNSLGQLEYTKSPDEGDAWFKYRKDGQIRFSQNSKQKEQNQMSYTSYDQRGRPIESGVYTSPKPLNFSQLNPDGLVPAGFRSEKHITVYDKADNQGLVAAFGDDFRRNIYNAQQFLAGNVAKTYTENPKTTTTWYNYDIYGRVVWIAQKIEGLEGVKTIDYEYDAITGLVNKVIYQKMFLSEQFVHRYTYDPDNYKLVKVETSLDNKTYTEHANYEYYETGALKSIDLAEGLQGIDYVYNLNGALKSINHPSLSKDKDPGGDANDLFGMNIHYYNGDYLRNTPKPIPNISNGIDQYNGNIKAITSNTNRPNEVSQPNTYVYKYNRNNWLTDARYNYQGNFESNYNAIENYATIIDTGNSENHRATKKIKWLPGFKAVEGSYVNAKIVDSDTGKADYDVSNITYDANGNIQSLRRNKNKENGSNAMDQLSYAYKTDQPNQLLRVDDAVTENTNANDIKDQHGENYKYNAIGQLIEDHEHVTPENPDDIIRYSYTASGLVSEVTRKNQPLVKFFYDDRGHRVRKEAYSQSGNSTITYYVRDASGTPMGIYNYLNSEVSGERGAPPTLVENTIYGASRLGVYKRNTNGEDINLYQLTDHLGNVRAVVGKTSSGQAIGLSSATDYYPFGMAMPKRTVNGAEKYRYTYQGQEKDPKTGKEAFQLRLWDGRIGRWLTTDPYGEFSSPYLGMANNPITATDPNGGCTSCFNFNTLQAIGDAAFIYGEGGFLHSDYFLDEVFITNKTPNSDFKAWKHAPFISFGTTPPTSIAQIQYTFTPTSGHPVWGTGGGTDEMGRKLGPNGELYDPIYTDELLIPGGGGGSFRVLGNGSTYSLIKRGIQGIQTGLGAQGHYDTIKTKLAPYEFNAAFITKEFIVRLDTRTIDSTQTTIWLHGSKKQLNYIRDSINSAHNKARKEALNYFTY